MAATTPAHPPVRASSHSRTRSNERHLPSRSTTPLRPPSRTSLRASQTTPSGNASLTAADFPLASLEPAFAELSDSMADLEANFMHLQLLNESLGRFNENFGAFLYGMNMSAFCVDFPEAPTPQSFARYAATSTPLTDGPFRSSQHAGGGNRGAYDGAADTDATFLTTDTSFVEDPPTSSKPANKYSTAPSYGSERKSLAPRRGGAAGRVARGESGIGRGTRGGTTGPGRVGRGSGVGRGVGRGRGRVR